MERARAVPARRRESESYDLDALLDEVREVPMSSSRKAFTWVVPDGSAVLMFAGDTVDGAVYGVTRVPLEGGSYTVESDDREVDDGAVTVVRLVRR